MAVVEKSYRASTGVDEFYYALVTKDDATSFTAGDIERVEYLQEIKVEMPQEPVRAYGDNKTAELAVSNGNVSVSSKFHTIPTEDKAVLFGLEKSTEGLYSYGSEDTPPYVACVFAKTYEDGSKEWVGLTKGMFMRPSIDAKTKETNVDFSSDEVTAEFMERFVEGFATDKTVLFGRDPKGETASRDALFTKIFGKAYPTAPVVPGV